MHVDRHGFVTLSPQLLYHEGRGGRSGVIRHGDSAILIDAADPELLQALQGIGIVRIDRVCFTHYHRDSVMAALTLDRASVPLYAPALERNYFESVEKFWNDPALRWHLYNYHPDSFMLPRSVRLAGVCKAGDSFTFGEAVITILPTPGHTDGSISYQVDGDGRRFIFCGDTLCGDGKVWDGYSLQKGIGIMDYHGFFGARHALLTSLDTLAAAEPFALIPTHGDPVRDPATAIARFKSRLAIAYRQYASTSALRYYYPKVFSEFDRDPGMMPIQPLLPTPPYLRQIETTWIIISDTGAALVLDCTNPGVAEKIKAMRDRGEIRSVEALWISHYHDDHVDGIARLKEHFDFPVLADAHVADVVERPLAWRLPCISPQAVKVDKLTVSGEPWKWREFTLTAFHLPGQTLYHGGLLCEGHGQRLFFTGDSFTPAGIDDYCTGNRNLLGSGQGVDAAVALVEYLLPDLLFNSHVEGAFRLTTDHFAFIRKSLTEREQSFGALFPWDHANYGLDPYWVRFDPYEQVVTPGSDVTIGVVLRNHSDTAQSASAQLVFPDSWDIAAPSRSALCPPRVDHTLSFRFTVPERMESKRWVLTLDLTYAGRTLGVFREAILNVAEPTNARE